MAVTVKMDNQGMSQFARSRQIQDVLMSAADRVESSARSIPIEGNPSDVNGYRAAFDTRRTTAKVRGGKGGDRAAAMVINDHDMESIFGGRNRTLYRALDALKGVKIV